MWTIVPVKAIIARMKCEVAVAICTGKFRRRTRATTADQLEALKWLVNKFPEKTKDFLEARLKEQIQKLLKKGN